MKHTNFYRMPNGGSRLMHVMSSKAWRSQHEWNGTVMLTLGMGSANAFIRSIHRILTSLTGVVDEEYHALAKGAGERCV